ncbi:hypothetical protein AAW14_33190 [Streptomyces hygroscopicus]|uniref:hypothetical protein n=1 Tax=Streptomyces hygroscopicus TaxID=1912 RepID=UPI0022408A13|nr:hypothetical protein [Streptomyces hygroscopicus]MCW7946707.1 hypothetical protein [Streptomyces hygroscopicus]
MGDWVYEFAGCPETGDFQQIASEGEPGEVVFHGRPGSPGIVYGYVRDSIDHTMMVARYRWVASGDPTTVAPAVLQVSAELPPTPGSSQ